MGVGQGQDQSGGDGSQNKKERKSVVLWYSAVSEGACPEYPPVPGKLIRFYIFFVIITINIVIENKSASKPKNRS
jgi:hypothetical protein